MVKADFIIARRCRLYQDKEQTKLVGRLQIAGSGTFDRHYHHESWQQKETYYVKQGDRRVRKTKWVHRSSTTDIPNTVRRGTPVLPSIAPLPMPAHHHCRCLRTTTTDTCAPLPIPARHCRCVHATADACAPLPMRARHCQCMRARGAVGFLRSVRRLC